MTIKGGRHAGPYSVWVEGESTPRGVTPNRRKAIDAAKYAARVVDCVGRGTKIVRVEDASGGIVERFRWGIYGVKSLVTPPKKDPRANALDMLDYHPEDPPPCPES